MESFQAILHRIPALNGMNTPGKVFGISAMGDNFYDFLFARNVLSEKDLLYKETLSFLIE